MAPFPSSLLPWRDSWHTCSRRSEGKSSTLGGSARTGWGLPWLTKPLALRSVSFSFIARARSSGFSGDSPPWLFHVAFRSRGIVGSSFVLVTWAPSTLPSFQCFSSSARTLSLVWMTCR